jgi:hypothetical protein
MSATRTTTMRMMMILMRTMLMRNKLMRVGNSENSEVEHPQGSPQRSPKRSKRNR